MEENNKTVAFTKRGFVWYSILSFLLVALMIYIAVTLTHALTIRSVGGAYAEKIALSSQGLSKASAKNISTTQAYHNGENVFRVEYEENGVPYVVYIGAKDGELKGKERQNESSFERSSASPSNPSRPMNENGMGGNGMNNTGMNNNGMGGNGMNNSNGSMNKNGMNGGLLSGTNR